MLTLKPGGGRAGGGGGRRRDDRTFTAATFFAHLLTLRMFRVYFFNTVTLRKDFLKKREKEEGERTHLVSVFTPPQVFISFLFVSCFFLLLLFWFFFVLTVTPAWNQVIPPTGMGCQRALCLENFHKKAVHTYFAFTTAKNKQKQTKNVK